MEQCVSRFSVVGGGRIRYGAAPRGPLERAVASSLLAHVGAAGTRRAIASKGFQWTYFIGSTRSDSLYFE